MGLGRFALRSDPRERAQVEPRRQPAALPAGPDDVQALLHELGAERQVAANAVSTFGGMFAANQPQAAAELGRVCRPGGPLSLAAWAPGGAVAEFFSVVGRHRDEPAPLASPLAWGDEAHVAGLLGSDFELQFEAGLSHAYHPSTEQIWECYSTGFGPVKQLAESLVGDRLRAFREDFDAYHRHYQTRLGLHVQREYLLILGTRR